MRAGQQRTADLAGLSDAELLGRARASEPDAFRAIMQRNNRRMYRVARSVLGSENEVEDVLQEAYLRAFAGLAGFRNDARLSTWLTRIVLNEALGRVRKRRPMVGIEAFEDGPADQHGAVVPFPLSPPAADPERAAARREIRNVLGRLIDELPAPFRVVFVMRVLEDMSVEETARILQLRPETVRTRLYRARQSLQRALEAQLASALDGIFPFEAPRCNRVAAAVLARLVALGLVAGS